MLLPYLTNITKSVVSSGPHWLILNPTDPTNYMQLDLPGFLTWSSCLGWEVQDWRLGTQQTEACSSFPWLFLLRAEALCSNIFFWSRTISQAISKQCESGERPSLEVALSFACWKAASVPHKENGTYNIGPQELDEYLTTKGSRSIFVVLRDCFKHAISLQGLLYQSWPSFNVCGGALCGQLISSHCW